MRSLSVAQPYQPRRRHASEFKARLVAECQKPGASVSRIALDNGLNANMLRRWVNKARRAGNEPSTTPAFVLVKLPAATTTVVEKYHIIRIDEIWLATVPLDMRVVKVFGSARPHCACLFANKRGNRMKVLVHDGLGIWLCARRLNRGKFHWGEI